MNYMIYPFMAVIGLVGVKTVCQYFAGGPRLSKEEVTNLLNREDELVDIINASIPEDVTPISVFKAIFNPPDLTKEYTELEEIREKIKNNLEMAKEIISEESSELEEKVIGLLKQERELVKTIKAKKRRLFPNIASKEEALYKIRLKLRKGTWSEQISTRNYPNIYSKIEKQKQQARQELEQQARQESEQLKMQEQNIEDQLAKEVEASTKDQVIDNQSTRGDTFTEAQKQEIYNVGEQLEGEVKTDGGNLLESGVEKVTDYLKSGGKKVTGELKSGIE